MMGIWFACKLKIYGAVLHKYDQEIVIQFVIRVSHLWLVNALIPADTNNLFIKEGLKAGAEISTYNNHNLIEILLICAIVRTFLIC